MKRILCALFIMSAVAVSGVSAGGSVDGMWVGAVQGDSGAQSIQVMLRVDETAGLVGQLMREGAGETAIREATIEGNVLKFDTVARDEAAVTLHWTGVINGDDITLSYRTDDQQTTPLEVVVHRQQ
jgi:hypothetical protein